MSKTINMQGLETVPAAGPVDITKALQGLYLPPTLAHDVMMKSRFKVDVSTSGHFERRIVWNLCHYMAAKGFEIHCIYDGEEFTKRPSILEVMNLIFNLDEVSLRFIKKGFTWHGVLLIMGNGNGGKDLISDWNYSNGDADGFNAAMHEFAFDNLDNWK